MASKAALKEGLKQLELTYAFLGEFVNSAHRVPCTFRALLSRAELALTQAGRPMVPPKWLQSLPARWRRLDNVGKCEHVETLSHWILSDAESNRSSTVKRHALMRQPWRQHAEMARARKRPPLLHARRAFCHCLGPASTLSLEREDAGRLQQLQGKQQQTRPEQLE